MLAALEVGEGDEVVTPSMTFASTVNQIALRGARPVFADSDYGTLQVLPDQVARAITHRTRAVIPVHFAGAPADLDPIRAADGRADVPVIEDDAHAVGTSYKGKPAGGHGDIAIYSFHPIKNVTTGEGGMVTCYDGEFAKKLRLLRFHGMSATRGSSTEGGHAALRHPGAGLRTTSRTSRRRSASSRCGKWSG